MCTTASKCNYEKHKPEETNLYQVVSQNWLSFLRDQEGEGRTVPRIVIKEFEKYLRCGVLAHGFGRLQCSKCHTDRLVAFSCKGRGWCPSCGARKMSETAALLVDSRIPLVPTRQFVVTFPMQLISVAECTQVILETLTAMGISPRAPPILPARDSKDLFSEYTEAFSEFGI